MKLLHVSLRGFIGLHDNLGLDQVDIDFSQFEPGMIAFVGENGMGKSTILENLHPYRKLASRAGALQHHVRLRDSHRILRFEMDGHTYECKILIDAQSGKQEAYLTCDNEPLTDGKTTTYDDAVDRIFGSEDLFFRALFRAQNAPSFNDLTEAKLKALFAELLGQAHYERFEERAKIHRNQAEQQLEAVRAKIEALEESVENAAELNEQLEAAQQRATTASADISAYTTEIEALQKQIRQAEIDLAALEDKARRRAQLDEDIRARTAVQEKAQADFDSMAARQEAELEPLQARLDRARKILNNMGKIEEGIATTERLEAAIAKHEAAKAERDDHERRTMQYRTKLSEINAWRDEENRKIESRNSDRIAVPNTDVAVAERKVHELETERDQAQRDSETAESVPCSDHPDMQASCAFLERARQAKTRMESVHEDIEAMRTKITEAQAEIEKSGQQRNEELAEIEKQYDEKRNALDQEYGNEAGYTDRYDEAAHNADVAALQEHRAANWPKLKVEAAGAEQTRIETESDLEQTRQRHADEKQQMSDVLDRHRAELQAMQDELEALDTQLAGADDLRESVRRFERDLGTRETAVETAKQQREEASADVARLEERIQATLKVTKEIEQLRAQETAVRKEYEEWLFIVQACGKRGILALELDAAGPRVSAIANDLLTGFGNGYQVEFVTQRLKADGKEQTDTFDILVRRGGNGDTVPLAMLSGGQRVWIDAALALSIGVYLRQQSTYDMQTTFMDEADGALDGARAHQYMDMVRACHAAAGIHHTIVITHRKELLAFIPQQVRLTPGTVEIVN